MSLRTMAVKMGNSALHSALLSIFLGLAGLSVVEAQPPLQNMSSVVIAGSAQCEPLTMSLCADMGYNMTIFPNMVGMMSQSDAEQASQSFAQLIQFGCSSMREFICYLLAPPCLEVGDIPVPVPPCRHICENVRTQCDPLFSAAGVPWPEQFACDRFPAIMDGPAVCTETDLRVMTALSEASLEVPPARQYCQDVMVEECRKIGYTSTSFPNIFDHTSSAEMMEDMENLNALIVSGCSQDILPLICGAYLPKCDPRTGNVINPCKEVCRRVSKECKDAMNELSAKRMDIFACRRYPSQKDGGTCVADVRAPAQPVILNVTRDTVSQAQIIFQQPEIPDVSVSGSEITFFSMNGDDGGTTPSISEGLATVDVMTGARYTLLARAVNDWGISTYVDATIPEFPYEHCEKLTIPMCTDMKYSHTQYPNNLKHTDQQAASMEVMQFTPLVQTACSPSLKPLLCSLYAPPCSPQGIKPPCRELCEAAQNGCEALMISFGYEWPALLNCTLFPSMQDVGRHCFNNDGLSVWPANQGRGEVTTIIGSSATAFCSSGSAERRPSWYTPQGVPLTVKTPDMSDSGMDVFSENVGSMTSMLTIKALSADNMGTYSCRLEDMERLPMDITVPKSCARIESNICMNVLPYTDSLYPNILGHTSRTEAELASYQFLPLVGFGCSPVNLPLFVCTLFHPKCLDTGMIVLPCMELCQSVMTECALYMIGAQWPWPEYAQCSQFPSAADGGTCVPPVEIPTPPTTPMATTPMAMGPTEGMMVNVTVNETMPMTAVPPPSNASNATMGRPGDVLLKRSYAVSERGLVQMFRGWVDVQGQGAPNDFCRVVRTDGKPFLSCLLAGAETDDLYAYTSPNPSVQWFDPGYSNTWYMKDEDGDGRDDYCRCIGSLPSTVVVCMSAGPNGFKGAASDFVPADAPDECLFHKADPFFGFE